jgi:hypothetical protein
LGENIKDKEMDIMDQISALSNYRKKFENSTIKELETEKGYLLSKLFKKPTNMESFNQLITYGFTIIVLIASLSYYLIDDSAAMIGLGDFIDNKYELLNTILEDINSVKLNLSIDLTDDDKSETQNQFYLKLADFVNDARTNTYKIIMNEQATFDFENEYRLILKEAKNISDLEVYYPDLNNISDHFKKFSSTNRDFEVFRTKSEVIEAYLLKLIIGVFILFVLAILLSYFVNSHQNKDALKRYFNEQKLLIIDELINFNLTAVYLEEPEIKTFVVRIKGI